MRTSDSKDPAVHDGLDRLATRSDVAAAASLVSGAVAPATNATRRSVTDLFEVRVALFEVPPSDADRIACAAREVASYAQANEPNTRFFGVLRDQDRPGRFVYAAVFDDAEAERTHRASPPARRFAEALSAAGVRLDASRWTGVAGV